MKHASKTARWLPLLTMLTSALFLGHTLLPWAFMWTICFALFFGCKWLTWRTTIAEVRGMRDVGYLLAWPGMDARTFLDRTATVARPSQGEWAAAILKTLFGAVVVWGVARRIPADRSLLAGWTGMIGLIFLLHFGSFHLLSLAWRRFNVDARPIMRAPMRSTSLSEFWGLRWNLAFRQLCRDYVFRPAMSRTGVGTATLIVFLVSGLVHELVISFPAGGGYGLPTAYFLGQGVGILLEHSAIGKWAGIQSGVRGWLFTLLLTAGPAFWLFHPPFIHSVMIPFLKTIHSLGGGVLS